MHIFYYYSKPTLFLIHEQNSLITFCRKICFSFNVCKAEKPNFPQNMSLLQSAPIWTSFTNLHTKNRVLTFPSVSQRVMFPVCDQINNLVVPQDGTFEQIFSFLLIITEDLSDSGFVSLFVFFLCIKWFFQLQTSN